MYIQRKQAFDLFREYLQDYTAVIQNHNSYLDDLTTDSDWSFVIKAQALVESITTNAILANIGDNRLRKTVEVMPLVGEEASKLAIAKSLGLLTKAQRRFIKKLASLRNKLAHRADCADFTFDEFFGGFNDGDKRDWQESVTWFANTKELKEKWKHIAIDDPRNTIYVGIFILVWLLELDGFKTQYMRKLDETASNVTSELLSQLIEN